MGPAEAPAVGCQRCSAPLPLAVGAESVRCSHCEAQHDVARDLQVRLSAHQAQARDATAREMEARFRAVFYEQNKRGMMPFIVGTVASAVVATAWFLVMLAPRVTILVLAPMVLLAWVSTAALAWGWGIVFAPPTIARLEAARVLGCTSCGACTPMSAGSPVSACEYCGSTRVVPASVAAELLHQVRGQAAGSTQREAGSWVAAVAAGGKLVVAVVASVAIGGPAVVVFAIVFADVAPLPAAYLVPLPALGGAAAVGYCAWATVRMSGAKRALDERVHRARSAQRIQ